MLEDQGDIIFGVRSEKYPEFSCYGVVVSASCDIANSKVGKIYYLTALPFEQWILTERGFKRVFGSIVKNKESSIAAKIKGMECSWKILQRFSYEEIKTVIESQECKEKKRNEIMKSVSELFDIKEKETTVEGRKDLLHDEKFCQEAITFLREAEKGSYEHLYFLPKSEIDNCDNEMSDLVIDLQEIDYLSLTDYKDIHTSGIDYLLLSECEGNKRFLWQKKFWLKCDMDYVYANGQVRSPRREHLIQRFAHVFNRIGINYLSEEQYKDIVHRI